MQAKIIFSQNFFDPEAASTFFISEKRFSFIIFCSVVMNPSAFDTASRADCLLIPTT